ncbi:MAG TPA: hypothetical protein VM534_10440 [Thermoanaerobaculia bacterium]|nr:hypothetical protein [Thermoanaerobaculia bacterium]
MFTEAVAAVLEQWGVRPETKAALHDLYVALGGDAIEVFAEIAETRPSPADVAPADLAPIQLQVAERYLRRHHRRWLDGETTPGFWRPREGGGRAAGLVVPMGSIGEDEEEEFAGRVHRIASAALPEGQRIAPGMLVLGRNAHFGGRSETISFDVVPFEIEHALEFARAEGRQHTVPGSAGETSGTADTIRGAALIWEIQPNVLKPAGERNREIAQIFRRHRNWHLTTLAAWIEWARGHDLRLYAVRGSALKATHEVNPNEPISDTIMALHDRALEAVTRAAGLFLIEPDEGDQSLVAESWLPNTGLRTLIERQGLRSAVWRVA